jgi:hypothetical protein
MRLRSLVLLGAGVAIGFRVARKLSEDDPEVVSGPSRTQAPSNPVVRLASSQAQRLADRATVASLDAIRRARGAIRDRLGDDEIYDDATWN